MDKQEIIKALNEDLSGEFGRDHSVHHVRGENHWALSAAALRILPARKCPTSRCTLNTWRTRLSRLGGEPTTKAREVPAAKSNRDMVEAVLEAEKRAVADYTKRAKQAEEFGDKGMVVQLEDIVNDETGHKEETERLLRDWPL